MDENTKIVRDYYDLDAEKEWNRIANRPEFLLTCRMLDRYINPGDTILDIGGGPGRYSIHLAEKGCEVTLFDLSSENIKYAKKRAAKQHVTISTLQGDVRDADTLIDTDNKFDHVLLMGPLYHLLEEADRVRAVEAGINLLKPGGILFASFISLFAGIIFYMTIAPELIASDAPNEVEYKRRVIAKENYAGDAFTKAFFISQTEILPFMARFPLDKLHLFGQEGITSPCEKNIMSQPEKIIDQWLDLCEETWEREDLLSWSEHLMYVGRKRGEPEYGSPDSEEEIQNEIARYNSLQYTFDGFIKLPELSDGVIHLVCTAKNPAIPEIHWVPSYEFIICKGSEKIGNISLRIGYGGGEYNANLYYGGQIGYCIDEPYRGNGYAVRACSLLASVAKAHGMSKLVITNNYTNTASKRVCEKLGARLVRIARLPEWHDLYKTGSRYQNIFEWNIE